MKTSKYTYITSNGTQGYVMYNTNSDMLLGINQTLLDLFQQYRNNIDSLQEIHHDFYDILCQKGFLIDDNVDETESLIEKWNEEENNEKRLLLIINPTLDCNFRCWYCYEEHKNIMNMTPEVRKAISHFLQKQCAIPEREYIGLSFFGGEPLLMFDDVVMPLVHDLYSFCKANEKSYSIGFTTNGYLLTPKVVDQLKEAANCNIFFQITLDGNRAMHNKTRFAHETRDGSYDTIVTNIKYAISNGCSLCIRLNYTPKNITSFIDILDDLDEIKSYDNYHIDFQRVWQTRNAQDISSEVTQVKETFRSRGFKVSMDSASNKTHCYADYKNNFVINYNGNVYKCTARDFKDENRKGILTPEGDIIMDEAYNRCIQHKYERKACMDCIIFPICHAGCIQHKLEHPSNDTCLRGYSTENVRNVITERILNILAPSPKEEKACENL